MPPDVIVAVITGLAAVGAASIPAWISLRRKAQATSDVIGSPDDHATIFGMLADLLHMTTRIDEATKEHAVAIVGLQDGHDDQNVALAKLGTDHEKLTAMVETLCLDPDD